MTPPESQEKERTMRYITEAQYQSERAFLVRLFEQVKRTWFVLADQHRARQVSPTVWQHLNDLADVEIDVEQAIRGLDSVFETQDWTTQEWAEYRLVLENSD